METIDINEVFAQANVVENLKNFAGIDAQNALGMMTPERLAAVVGGLFNKGIVVSGNADDLKEQGCYHLIDGSTPLYVFIIVLKIGAGNILQIRFSDGGGGMMSRVYSKTSWRPWK